MKFGFEKCAKATLNGGEIVKSSDFALDKTKEIREWVQSQEYK